LTYVKIIDVVQAEHLDIAVSIDSSRIEVTRLAS